MQLFEILMVISRISASDPKVTVYKNPKSLLTVPPAMVLKKA